MEREVHLPKEGSCQELTNGGFLLEAPYPWAKPFEKALGQTLWFRGQSLRLMMIRRQGKKRPDLRPEDYHQVALTPDGPCKDGVILHEEMELAPITS